MSLTLGRTAYAVSYIFSLKSYQHTGRTVKNQGWKFKMDTLCIIFASGIFLVIVMDLRVLYGNLKLIRYSWLGFKRVKCPWTGTFIRCVNCFGTKSY